MTQVQKDEITRISKEFASGFQDIIGGINGSQWLIVDPLSGYLNSLGYANILHHIPENELHPQVLIMSFDDGSKFIPAGGDLKNISKEAHNWMWL